MIFDFDVLIIIIVLILAVIFTIFFLVLLMMRTNAWTEFKATMRGTPLISIWRHDRTRDLVTCSMPDYMAETKKYGNYTADTQAVYIDKKTKLRMANALPQLGTFIPPEYAKMAESLRKMGIHDFQVARRIYEEDYRKVLSANKEVEAQMKADGKSELEIMQTLKPSPDWWIPIEREGMVNFKEYLLFAQNAMTPWFLKSSVERRVSESLKGLLKDNIKILMWAMAAMMVLVGGGIAYTIITQNAPKAVAKAMMLAIGG